jgi:lactate dehydrogenase-like 2-hydroxyacid dehydrogenase
LDTKIVFLDASTIGDDISLDSIKEFGSVTLYDSTNTSQTLNRVKDASIVITNKVVINKDIMDNSNIKLICVAATGMNNIDLDYAKERGIVVKNVAGYSTQSVVNITFAMALNLSTKLSFYDSFGKSDWSSSKIFTNVSKPFSELYGKTWGVIGLGTIGKEVAKVAKAFGCNIVYYSTSGKNSSSEYKQVELEELLKSSDIVSVHAPLNDKTLNLLDYEKLDMLKSRAILINVGRGSIVNEEDVAKIIDEKELYFGIDVMPKEPITKEHPILRVKNSNQLVLTPHIAWTSIEARESLVDGIAKNIESFVNG